MRGRKISKAEFRENYTNVDPKEINAPETGKQRRIRKFREKTKVDQLGIKISKLIIKKQDMQLLGERSTAYRIQKKIDELMKERHKAMMTEKFVNWKDNRDRPEKRITTWDGERFRSYKRSI